MGVPGLYGRWIKGNYGNSLKSLPNNNSSLSVDLNALIHTVVNEIIPDPTKRNVSLTEDILTRQIIDGTKEEILRLVDFYQPREYLILATDGVAPIAKENQQQFRRFRSAIKHPESLLPFDRNCVSPGTAFMIDLDLELQNFLRTNLMRLPPNVRYSNHLVPGEGEHKIMEYFRTGLVAGNGHHIVYGMDADFVLLSLVSPLPNIVLARNFEREGLFIDDLRKNIRDRCNGRETAIDDFVFLASMIGNDFLPIMPIFSSVEMSLELILQIYLQALDGMEKGSIIVDKQVDIPAFFHFMKYLNTHSETLLRQNQLYQEQLHFKSKILIDPKNQNESGTIDPTKFRMAWAEKLLEPRAEDSIAIENAINREHEDKYTFGTKTDDVIKMVNDYIRTLAWVYSYYKEGTAKVNFEWAYTYYQSPHPAEVTYVLNEMLENGATIRGHLAFEGMIKFTPFHQMLAILPKASARLLPKKLQPLVLSPHSPIYYRYVSDFKIEREGVDKEHEGICILPFIDPQEIYVALLPIVWKTSELEPYIQQEDIVFARNFEQRLPVSTGNFRGRGGESRGGRGGRGRGGETSRGRGGRGGRGRGGETSRGRGGRGRAVTFYPTQTPQTSIPVGANPFGFTPGRGTLINKKTRQ